MADMLVGLEGFETDDDMTMWEYVPFSNPFYEMPLVNVKGARSGNKGLYFNGEGGITPQSWLWNPTKDAIIGFSYRWNLLEGTFWWILSIRGPSDVEHVGLYINSQTILYVKDAAGNNHYGTKALDQDTWYYIEVRVKVHPSAGEIEVRVNGNPTPEILVQGVDTQNGNDYGGTNQFWMGPLTTNSLTNDCEMSFDDIYVRDNSTGLGFLGDVEVIGYALVDDFLVEWTRNGGAKNYERVIENPPDDEVTYVETNQVSGIKRDLYEVGDTGYQGEILAVQLVSRARKTSTHLWTFRNKMYLSGVLDDGRLHYLAYPNYETFPPDVFGTDPNGDPWSIATFNAMKVGFEAEPVDNVP